MTLEFQAAKMGYLPAVLLGGVSLILLVWGARELLASRRRAGLLSVAAAAGPGAMLLALLADGAVRLARDDWPAARRSLLAAAMAGTAMLLGATLVALVDTAGAAWLAILAFQLTTAVCVLYWSAYTYLGPARLGVLLALRILACLGLLLILFKPAILTSASPPGRLPALAILVDRSASMSTADEPSLPGRHAQALAMLRSQAGRIERHFSPAWIPFAAKPGRASSLVELGNFSPTGPGSESTDIAAAIAAAADGSGGKLAGVILISDGVANTPGDLARRAAELEAPIYALAVGTPGPGLAGANLQLLAADGPWQVPANVASQIIARVSITNMPKIPCQVALFEGDDATPVATAEISTDEKNATVSAKLNWTPRVKPATDKTAAAPDVRKLRLKVSPLGQAASETNRHDNAAQLHVLVTNPKIRLLYIEGAIRPEYKYLRRELQADPNVQFVGLIRISPKKFWSQGSIDGRKLDRLPTGEEDLAGFDVIIIGSLDSSFFTAEAQVSLREFVVAGGGLLMIGGPGSFGPGGYGNSAIATALPIEIGPRSTGAKPGNFVPKLTAAGEVHPIFSGISGYFPGPGGRGAEQGLAKLPPLQGLARVRRAKPAATVLAVHPAARNEAGPLTVLAVQQFGAGRSGAFMAGDTWLWYLPMRAMGSQSPYHRFWGQLVRWLGGAKSKNAQARSAALLRLEKSYCRLGRGVKISAFVQGVAGQPSSDAQVVCKVRPVKNSQPAASVTLLPAAGPGVYSARFSPSSPGDFLLELTARDAAGKLLGRDELPLKVFPRSKELEDVARNDALLAQLAKASTGQLAELAALPDVLDIVIARAGKIAKPSARPTATRLYNFPILFVLFVALLTAEWLLRRKWQMH